LRSIIDALFARAVFREANEELLIRNFFENMHEGVFVEVGAPAQWYGGTSSTRPL
jgi:hypothetical protein